MTDSTYQPPSLGGPDSLAQVSETTPDVQALQQEYQYAWNQDPDVLSRIAHAEDIRYTRWPGQSSDGLKHQEALPEGQRAMPYDRAPDCRVNLADGIVLSLLDVEYSSFWNARVKTAPVGASRLSAAQAGEWRALISWMIHGPLRSKLIDQVEFVSQVLHTIGWVVLHPTWRKREQLRTQEVSMDMVAQLAQRAGPETLMGSAPALIADPESEEAAADLVGTLYPNLTRERARRVVRDLRTDGHAEFPAPEVVSNGPELSVLVPWQDFILPIEATAAPDEARAMFRRMFLSVAQVKERAREEEWREDFAEQLINTKGQSMEDGTSQEHDADENMQFIEVIYGYNRGVDKDGVPGIYCTVFSPHLQAKTGEQPMFGQHWLIDNAHGQYPFIFLTTEVTGRRPSDARGVPDVVMTSQMEMKQQRDATYVYSQLSVTPPLQKRGTQASKLPPELGPLGIINNVGGGEWSWFPPPPGRPDMAFKLIEDVRREAEDYYAVPRADLPPPRYVPRQQRKVMRFLAKWGEAFWQLSCLAYQHLEPAELQALLGHAPLLTAEQVAKHALMLWFDVRSLDPAWVESLLSSISQFVLPADTAGVVDRSKLIQFALAYLDPTLAEEVTTDQEGAKQAMFKGVRDEIGSIMQGNEGLYSENDPTAKTKLLFANQILHGNPDYTLQLDERSPQFNGRKRELLDKWLKNLTQSAMQQDNKIIGRLGVRPGAVAGNGT